MLEEAKVLQIEPNTTYRKYKDSAYMSLIDHPITQPSVDRSPVWAPIITAEVENLQLRLVCRLSGKFVFLVLVPYGEFVSLVMTSSLIFLWCKASFVYSFLYYIPASRCMTFSIFNRLLVLKISD
jgi:hypothetical protein